MSNSDEWASDFRSTVIGLGIVGTVAGLYFYWEPVLFGLVALVAAAVLVLIIALVIGIAREVSVRLQVHRAEQAAELQGLRDRADAAYAAGITDLTPGPARRCKAPSTDNVLCALDEGHTGPHVSRKGQRWYGEVQFPAP